MARARAARRAAAEPPHARERRRAARALGAARADRPQVVAQDLMEGRAGDVGDGDVWPVTLEVWEVLEMDMDMEAAGTWSVG